MQDNATELDSLLISVLGYRYGAAVMVRDGDGRRSIAPQRTSVRNRNKARSANCQNCALEGLPYAVCTGSIDPTLSPFKGAQLVVHRNPPVLV